MDDLVCRRNARIIHPLDIISIHGCEWNTYREPSAESKAIRKNITKMYWNLQFIMPLEVVGRVQQILQEKFDLGNQNWVVLMLRFLAEVLLTDFLV